MLKTVMLYIIVNFMKTVIHYLGFVDDVQK